MADQTPSSISTPRLGAITSGLQGYNSGTHHSTGASSTSGRSNQLISLSLDAFIDTDVTDIEDKDQTTLEEGKQISESQKSFLEQIWDGVKKTAATVVVGATSIVSGIVDIAEAVVDGAAYLAAGAMDLVGLDDAAKATREFIAKDLVGDANDWLYHNVGLFEWANENSAYAYDSPEMQGLRDLSKKVGEFALATVLTICTGGLATAGVGFLFGVGEAAEDSYQKYGTDLTLLQNGLILLQGGASALSWYSQGKLGKGLVEIVKTANLVGVWETLSMMKDQVFNKEFVKKLFTKGNVIGNIISTLAQGSGDIADICRRLVNGEEVTAEEWARLFGELCIFFALNTLEDAGRNAILDFKIDEDTARMLAERLTDVNDELDIYSLLALNDDSLAKIMSQMSAEEIAKVVKDLDPDAAARVLGSLAPDKLEKVTGILNDAAETKTDDVAADVAGVETAPVGAADVETPGDVKSDEDMSWKEYYEEEYGAENVEHMSGTWTVDELKEKYPEIDPKLIEKYPEVYGNPLYCYRDPSTGKVIVKWPEAEGAAEYAAHGWTTEDLVNKGNGEGVDALTDAGARKVTLEELKAEEGDLTRVTKKPKIDDDGYGEFYGGGSLEGDDDIPHRVLGPDTTENHTEPFRYHISDDADIDLAETKLNDGSVKTPDIYTTPGGEPYTGEVHIVAVETHAADFYDQEGGAKQIVFYLTDDAGHILIKENAYTGGPQLYKLTRDQLRDLGIIEY